MVPSVPVRREVLSSPQVPARPRHTAPSRHARGKAGLLWGLAATPVLLAILALVPTGSAWTATDNVYDARDSAVAGGPVNSWSTYDISSSGTSLGAIPDDGVSANFLPSGFSFDFYGLAPVSAVQAHGNGYITFNNNGGCTTPSSPGTYTTACPNYMVTGIWNDWTPGNGQVRYQLKTISNGGTNEDVLVTQYTGVPPFSGTGSLRAQFLLFEDFDTFEIHYNNAVGRNAGWNALLAEGNGNAGQYIVYYDNTGGAWASTAIQYRPKTGVYPIATADAYTLDYQDSTSISVPDGCPGIGGTYATHQDLLCNDRKVGSVPITAVKLTNPTSGTLTFNSNGAFSFTPPTTDPCGTVPGGSKDYTFTYQADDIWPDDASAPMQDETTVTVTVKGCNEPPVATADSYTDLVEDTLYAGTSVLDNDTDPDDDALTATLVTGPTKAQTFALNSDGTFSYQGIANYNGADSFTYKADDGQEESNTVTVSLTLQPTNDAPVATAATSSPVEDRDQSITLGGTDIDVGDSITGCTVTVMPVKGALTPVGGTSCTRNYRAATDYSGPDSFQFTVFDGEATSASEATLTINVLPYNDFPDAKPASGIVPEDQPTVVTGIAADRDQGNLASCQVETQPAHGTVTIAPGICKFSYTSALDYWGADSFTYSAKDDLPPGDAGAIATFSVSVTNTADMPVGNPPDVSLLEDSSYGPTSGGYQPFAVDPNASTPDPEKPTCTVVASPKMGRVEGTYCDLVYIPDPNRSGTDSFSYTVTDAVLGPAPGTHVAKFTILGVNDPPIADAATATLSEDTSRALTLSGRDVETATASLGCRLDPASLPAHGTVVPATGTSCSRTYFPAPDYFGPDSFGFVVTDGAADSTVAILTLDVLPVQDLPVGSAAQLATFEDVALAVNLAHADADGASTCRVTREPAHGSLSGAACNRTYTPDAHFHGLDAFDYVAEDLVGGTSPAYTIDIAIEAVDDAPVATADAFLIHPGIENAIDAEHGVLSNDFHPDGLTMRAELASLPAHGSVTLAPDGSFSYIPSIASGKDGFAYRVRDSDDRVMLSYAHLDIRANQGPKAGLVVADAVVGIGQAARFFDASSDPDGDLSHVWDFGDGTTSELADPTHAYQAAGVYSVSLRVFDAEGAADYASGTITVSGPAAQDGSSAPSGGAPAADAGRDVEAAPGQTVRIAGAMVGGEAMAYLWVQVGGPVVELQGLGTKEVTFTAPARPGEGLQAVELELVVFDGRLSSPPDRVIVFLLPGAPPSTATVDAGEPQSVAPGTVVRLAPTPTGFTGGTGFLWQQVAGPIVSVQTGLDGHATFTSPDAAGELVFEVVALDGVHEARDRVTVLVQDGDAGFTFQRGKGADAGVVHFTATNPGPHVWDFGDGTTATGASVSHRFTESGTFPVKMRPASGPESVQDVRVTVSDAGSSPASASGLWLLAAGGALLVAALGAGGWAWARQRAK